MDLIAVAIPFFLLAIVAEWAIDRRRGSELYRANDAISSLSAGMLSTTFGYFTKLLPLVAWGFVLEHVALFDMPPGWFDLSARGVALWVTAAILWDLSYYWFHRFSHEISILWAAHAVHHQSEDYNLSTALRQTSTGFLFGWLFYLPLFAIGFPLEVLVTVNAVNLIYQFWVHTQVVGRLGVLDRILVTPSNHRVHHAQNARYIDRNYGGMLIIWDRLFGTFEDERDDDPVVFGVRKPLASWNPFWANLQVYDYLLFDARRTARWRDKLGIWFRRTGWRPNDVARRFPAPGRELGDFRKFDPAIGAAMRRYATGQFAVAVAWTLLTGYWATRDGLQAVILPCVLLWALLYGIGCVNEGRPGAARSEAIRLLLVTPAATGLMMATGAWPAAQATAWLVLYTGLSVAWLFFAKTKVKHGLINVT
jgi:sterol desaturase/sphingolipid hydroxylase (fatty acid hydroxylase superfamily)